MTFVRVGLRGLVPFACLALATLACDAKNGGGTGATGGGGTGAGTGKGQNPAGGINGSGGSAGAAGGSAGTVSGPATTQCKQLRAALCDRMVECVGDTDPSNDVAERLACDIDLDSVLPCDRAEAVEATLPQCVNDLNRGTCASLFPGGSLDLPVNCGGVLTFTQSPAEKQCNDLVSLVCKRLIDCGALSGVTQEECATTFSDDLGCFEATGVAPTYDACISKLTTSTCAVVVPAGNLALPTECQEVLLFDAAGGTGGMGGTGGGGGRGGAIGLP